MSVTTILIGVTVIWSLIAFNRRELLFKQMLNPYKIVQEREYYRLVTSGFIHADWGHLIFNMITLYCFGAIVEQSFNQLFSSPKLMYLVFYLSAIVVASLYDLYKYRSNSQYNALGASGAISAILFAAILFAPTMGIYIMFIPIPIPAIIFAPLYLIYCQWMARRGRDNIGHNAHFWGAVYGLLFVIMFRPSVLHSLIENLRFLN